MVVAEKFVWPPVHGVWKFWKSLYTGQNSKLSQTYRVTYQNKRERGTKTLEKELAQSDLPVWRKIQKNTQNVTFLKNCIFGMFLGFFSKLVNPIELIHSLLSQCLSRACFDRPLDRSATTLNFYPYIVIFKIFRPHVRGVKRTFWQKQKFPPSFKHKTTPKNAR